MRLRHALVPTVLAVLVVPAAALAGAPNYDCVVNGGRARLAIDQWRPKVVAIGIGAHRTVGGAVSDIRQDGPSLDFTTTLAGDRWSVAIRESGRSLTMASAGGQLTGRCTIVPGNFILRAADRGGHVLRAAPSLAARPRSTIATGGPVWERPDASPRGRWLPVLVVLPPGGRSVTATGWLRQLGPYQSRPN
jgi:hypothetical protein